MILVDTSVWIDFFLGKSTPFRRELHRLIENGVEVGLTGIIYQEILQGIRSDIEHKKTEKYLKEFKYVVLSEPETFRHAAAIFRACAKKGKNIRKPLDVLIAAQAIEADVELFHNDRDFNQIASIEPLKIYRLPPE